MQPRNTLSPADTDYLARIESRAQTYFEAMKTAAAEGGKIEDYIDAPAVAALKQITMLADKDASGSPLAETSRIVPTVTESDEKGTRAYDLFSLLMKQRIVLLEGGVDEGMASIACASLLYLNSSASGAPGEEIKVHINSPGGSVIAGQAIYDTMRAIQAPVTTIGYGMQASMGSILLAAGDTRKMTKGSKLMIHSIASQTQGKLAEQEIGLEVTRRLFEEMKAIYTAHIGLTPQFWDLACANDSWFSADQAKKMGFIHEIITGDRKPAPYGKAAADFLKAAADERESKLPKKVEELEKMLHHTGGDKTGELRAEVLTALSQFPKYWTKEKQAEMAAQAKAVANDNNTASKPVAKKKASGEGPTA
jgi:ATP-dependent Clp protease protease subunit